MIKDFERIDQLEKQFAQEKNIVSKTARLTAHNYEVITDIIELLKDMEMEMIEIRRSLVKLSNNKRRGRGRRGEKIII